MEPLPLSAYTNRILHAIPVPRRFEQSQLFKFQDKAADRRIEFLFLPVPYETMRPVKLLCASLKNAERALLDGEANYAPSCSSNRSVMFFRPMPNVEVLCSSADIAGGSTPATPKVISDRLKATINR